MFVTGPVLRSLLVVLLLAFSCGKRRCNYMEILGSYRELVLVELHGLNLTGSYNNHEERDYCPSDKAHRLLRSIYGMIQQFWCRRGGKLQEDLTKPVHSMAQLIFQNCSQDYLVRRGLTRRDPD